MRGVPDAVIAPVLDCVFSWKPFKTGVRRLFYVPASISRGRLAQNPREAKSRDFPANASVEEQLKFLVNFAVLAPSVHNTQPWLFRVLDHTVEIYADRSRALPVVDPEDRSLVISCGSCVSLFGSVLDAFGFPFSCSVFPDMSDPDLMARITVSSRPDDVTIDEDQLKAITSRNTIRRGFQSLPLPTAFTAHFVGDEDALPEFLCVVKDREAETLILKQVQDTERTYQSDIRYRRESDSWMHPMRQRSRDGIPMNPEEPTTISSCWSSEGLSDHSTLLMVLTEPSDTPRAWLETGDHLMQVLIKAASFGVNAAIMNLPATSKQVREIIKPLTQCEGDPILLLRFGRPQRKLITPRRSSVDVMLHPGFRH